MIYLTQNRFLFFNLTPSWQIYKYIYSIHTILKHLFICVSIRHRSCRILCGMILLSSQCKLQKVLTEIVFCCYIHIQKPYIITFACISHPSTENWLFTSVRSFHDPLHNSTPHAHALSLPAASAGHVAQSSSVLATVNTFTSGGLCFVLLCHLPVLSSWQIMSPRKCLKCGKSLPSEDLDPHSLCVGCRLNSRQWEDV